MTKFIELHDFSGDSTFINTDRIVYFSSRTSKKEGISCALICTHRTEAFLIVKETPEEILEKIREAEVSQN
ncbi:hypothetical protein EZS27_009184 [termite gut metagenome]|uniref:Uncharacterized protein n=1 Tax=termite gut metagenome TaxID=433724 RepID=A0A5J4SB69_9ZZZZ